MIAETRSYIFRWRSRFRRRRGCLSSLVKTATKATATKTTLENNHLENVDYFAIIASSSHLLLLTELAASGLVEAPLK